MRPSLSIRLAFALVVAVALLAVAQPALACTCSGTLSGQPACALRWNTSAVFVGRVLRIEEPPPRADGLISSADNVRVHLAVLEGFTGVPTPETVVNTARMSSSCGYDFKVGETYLVYANGAPDALGVSLCGGTRLASEARDDLQYLRAVPATPGRDGRIIGIVEQRPVDSFGEWRRYEGARVFVEGEGLRRSSTTNRDGRFEIRVPAGRYRVRGEVGRGLYIDPWFDTDGVTLKDSRGCATADFSVEFDGHVLTRVVTASGEPVPHLPLGLTSIFEDPGLTAEARTDARGNVDIARVPPGRYRLGFLDVFFPGTLDRSDARVVTVAPGGRVSLDRFVVPGSVRLTTLSGVVRDALGQVVAGAEVAMQTDEADARRLGVVVTDARGQFIVTVPADRKYVLSALQRLSRSEVARGEVQGVVAAQGMDPITITVKRGG